MRRKIIGLLVDAINETAIGVTDLPVEDYGEIICAQNIVLNARFLRYIEPKQVITRMTLMLLPLLMHLIKMREEFPGCFRLVTDQRGSIDIDKTKQHYSLGVRGRAGAWWIS